MAGIEVPQKLIPQPNGRYKVGYSTAKLVDTARVDPEDPTHGHRQVMISLFYPIENATNPTTIPYMPPMAKTFLDTGLTTRDYPPLCSKTRLQIYSGPSQDIPKFRLVIISPGLSFMRHQYNIMAQSLAAVGYAVVTIDHPYDAMIVDWPDGTYTRGKYSETVREDPEKHRQLLATRVADVSFVLTQLGDLEVVQQLIPDALEPFDSTKAAILGHSFGGATAVSALMQDKRFKGAMNMDGSQYGPLTTPSYPVVLFGRGEPDARNRSNNETWQTLYSHLNPSRTWEINLKECRHGTFCDFPLVLKLHGIAISGFAEEMAGTLDGERAFKIIMAYIKDFVDMVFEGRTGELYKGPSELYPEIEFVTGR